MKDIENWFSRAKAEADKCIPRHERVVDIAIVTFSILMILYFGSHQMQSTGFFTSKFSTMEMLMLYGFWIFWITTAGLEGVLGRRLLSRLFDVFGGIIFSTIAIVWLLVVFPFEFENFAEVSPESIRFLVQWISNDIARVIMVLLMIVHLGAIFFSPIGYKFVDEKRFKRKKISD